MSEFERLLEFEFVGPLTKSAMTAAELSAATADMEHEPSAEQKKSGNYKLGHVVWNGLNISIETAKGKYRSGVGKDGKPWKTLMKDAYGYFAGAPKSRADSDHVDVFVCDDNLDSELVFIVNQVEPSGKLDEHKVLVGCVSEAQARKVYLRNYEEGWDGLGSIKAMTLPQFKDWLAKGDTSKRANAVPDLFIVKRAAASDEPFTVAVDLDGTLAEHDGNFDPDKIGAVREKTLAWVKKFKAAGARIIIWTTRGAVPTIKTWLEENAVPYDYINENPSQPKGSSAKVIADAYFDDRAWNAKDPDTHGPDILEQIVPADVLLETLEGDHGD